MVLVQLVLDMVKLEEIQLLAPQLQAAAILGQQMDTKVPLAGQQVFLAALELH
jgi:hypothetical protein